MHSAVHFHARFLFLLLLLSNYARLSHSDYYSPECPYPCLPPPNFAANSPPLPGTPYGGYYPPPETPNYGYYPPPEIPNGGYYLPPPAGYLPYYTPPSYMQLAPPPPDPILPYFPFYFKSTPPGQASSAASDAGRACTGATMLVSLLVAVLLRPFL